MAKEIHFFMTKNDLIEVLRKSEENISLKYVEAKAYSSKEINEYYSLEEYEDIGINKSGNHVTERFLVVEKDYTVKVREVLQVDGNIRYHVDQMNNENSVLFWPGGIYENKYLICGHMSTIHLNDNAKKIFDNIQKNIKKQCKTKVGRYYVGEDAKSIYSDMRFITISINQASEYDLKL